MEPFDFIMLGLMMLVFLIIIFSFVVGPYVERKLQENVNRVAIECELLREQMAREGEWWSRFMRQLNDMPLAHYQNLCPEIEIITKNIEIEL